jgi:adenylylsulfate kinase
MELNPMKYDSSTHSRSFVKGFSWELISLIITFILALIVFGTIKTCIMFSAINFVVKLVFFYEHERLWHQIRWGKR